MVNGTHCKTYVRIKQKCDLQILRVNNENLMHVSEALPKIDFTILHRNMIINLCATVCDANNESEMNVVIRINACKKIFYLPLSLSISIVVGIIFWYFFNNPGHGTS